METDLPERKTRMFQEEGWEFTKLYKVEKGVRIYEVEASKTRSPRTSWPEEGVDLI